ncbi:MAG TPA: prephenate dehydratase [Candidatus Omnitrophica bacterium]|nr:prephenate dehydratase [Candidatus Omnitrophota bacterium]HBH96397.1 prephenate dehydratase [Candidatus Omnitrophota bacterium]HBQ38076.1 prephenate dehydratase [Candidatus Omnitrophota bacterium]
MTTIAYLGPEHTNTHVAARKRFGPRATYVHAPTVEDVFRLVEREDANYGVVPIENSLEGAVTHTLDRFIDFKQSPIAIQGEIEQPIHHALILRRGSALSQVRVVYSHPQALAQCRRWLGHILPHVTRRETDSTADAVSYVLRDKPDEGRAAIGRIELAEAHAALKAISIPEQRENKTRFLILGLGSSRRGRQNKTSVLFSLKDRPGALHDALVPFKRNRINLTKIESRPSKRQAWEYLFFIDLEGHVEEPRVKRALKGLETSTTLFKVLGSYPIGR